jgi:Fe-S-cluster containining protein
MVDCLANLSKCGAECCKVIPIPYPKPINLRKGTTIRRRVSDMNPDLRWYYDLHNVKVEEDMIVLKANRFIWTPTHLIIYQPCTLLDENNMCKGHSTGHKPEVCKRLDVGMDADRYYLTPNCTLKRT